MSADKKVLFRIILVLFFLLLWEVKNSFALVSFEDIKAKEGRAREYVGQTVVWEGTYTKFISNEAYFEYEFTLPSKDKIRVLSRRGIPFKVGDYLKITGFIMVKEGKFSHLVLESAERATRRKDNLIQGKNFIPLNASDKVIYDRIYHWILYYNGGISKSTARFIANRIVYHSRKVGTDPFLVTAIISAESAFNMYAKSVAGAIGLGQIMPSTAVYLKIDPFDPDQNIRGCALYIKEQLKRWQKSKNSLKLAIASYNAGPYAVEKYKGVPPYRETQDYVYVVLYLYKKIRSK